jgi:Protein of unknown function (DUF2490)
MIKRTPFCIGLFILTTIHSNAQTKSTQLWTDFVINIPLQKGFTFDNEFSYRTVLNSSDKWHSFNVIPKIEKSLDQHWDLMFYLGSINTLQQKSFNTWEIRPGIGVRYHFTPVNKLLIKILGRFELRNQYNIDSSVWSQDIRSRFRLEETYFINGRSFVDNHLWYALSDLEFFFTVDKELEERFSNRSLFRLGIGYKLSNSWRYECIYTYQFSKNTITGEFSNEQEGILRLRIKYYFE